MVAFPLNAELLEKTPQLLDEQPLSLFPDECRVKPFDEYGTECCTQVCIWSMKERVGYYSTSMLAWSLALYYLSSTLICLCQDYRMLTDAHVRKRHVKVVRLFTHHTQNLKGALLKLLCCTTPTSGAGVGQPLGELFLFWPFLIWYLGVLCFLPLTFLAVVYGHIYLPIFKFPISDPDVSTLGFIQLGFVVLWEPCVVAGGISMVVWILAVCSDHVAWLVQWPRRNIVERVRGLFPEDFPEDEREISVVTPRGSVETGGQAIGPEKAGVRAAGLMGDVLSLATAFGMVSLFAVFYFIGAGSPCVCELVGTASTGQRPWTESFVLVFPLPWPPLTGGRTC